MFVLIPYSTTDSDYHIICFRIEYLFCIDVAGRHVLYFWAKWLSELAAAAAEVFIHVQREY
jgi:hypothetical protein